MQTDSLLTSMETGLSVFQNFTGLFFCFSTKKTPVWLEKSKDSLHLVS